MTTFDEMTERFGKRCKWLDLDNWCHNTVCTLNRMRREVFVEKCESMGLDNSFWAGYEMFPEYCREATEDMGCFDGGERKTGYDVDEYLTESEKEAEAIAREEMGNADKIREMYERGMRKHIDNQRTKLKSEMEKLDILEKSVFGGQSAK